MLVRLLSACETLVRSTCPRATTAAADTNDGQRKQRQCRDQGRDPKAEATTASTSKAATTIANIASVAIGCLVASAC